jgi:hypothetical protein
MIGAGILASGFLCCLMCGYSSLKIAIDVIDAAAFLKQNKEGRFSPICVLPLADHFSFMLGSFNGLRYFNEPCFSK